MIYYNWFNFNKSDLFIDESDDDGYDSGYAGMCAFTFCFDQSIGRAGDFLFVLKNPLVVSVVWGMDFLS